jgi:hypothetical protein
MNIPPPPPKGAPQPQQPSDVAIAEKQNAHERRVTLNLIRHAYSCPTQLREVLDYLAQEDWNTKALTKTQNELIFALVDGPLGDRAKSEFHADTSTIIDHRSSDASCKLCGHKHIRWEFQLRNDAGGKDVWTGSTCIVQYGLRVDGEATSEDALARLNAAINAAKKKAYRDDWQKANPDHERHIRVLRDIYDPVVNRRLGGLYGLVKPLWKQRSSAIAPVLKAILKYYDKNKCLTQKRTKQLAEILVPATRMHTEYRGAVAEHDRRETFWKAYATKHDAKLDRYQRTALERAAYDALPTKRDEIQASRDWNKNKVLKIMDICEKQPELFDPVDNSDLPF